jgi:hypothetical protein
MAVDGGNTVTGRPFRRGCTQMHADLITCLKKPDVRGKAVIGNPGFCTSRSLFARFGGSIEPRSQNAARPCLLFYNFFLLRASRFRAACSSRRRDNHLSYQRLSAFIGG